jgi:transcriptional regulator with XRE-family HTH domain
VPSTKPTTPKGFSVGGELRKAREAAGLNQRQLSAKVGVSHVTIGRWERGVVVPRPEDVSALLAVLDVPADVREEIIVLARKPDDAHWLAVGMPEQHRQLSTLLDIESTARSITTVSPLLVPGLLQTADYARSIMRAAAVPKQEIATRVAVRIGRRDAITRKRAPVYLNAFIGEMVLHQVIGGAEVMAEQLRFLGELGKRANIELRIIPLASDWHPGLEGPFALDEFIGRTPVVHLENRISGLFLHEPPEVEAYQDAIAKVRDAAMSAEKSSQLIAEAIKRTGEKPS